jgi:hypothetical protein
MVDEEKKHERERPEDVKEILKVVSEEVPGLIKNLLSTVFSEEAGKNMGKAAAAYYKELKAGGLPEQVAVKLTEDYMRTFTSIGDMMRGSRISSERSGDVVEEVKRKVSEKKEQEL